MTVEEAKELKVGDKLRMYQNICTIVDIVERGVVVEFNGHKGIIEWAQFEDEKPYIKAVN